MVPVLIFVYAVLGLWSAERFKEKARSMSLWMYASIVLLWPGHRRNQVRTFAAGPRILALGCGDHFNPRRRYHV